MIRFNARTGRWSDEPSRLCSFLMGPGIVGGVALGPSPTFTMDGHSSSASLSSTYVYTMSSAIGTGKLIIVVGAHGNSGNITGVADSRGNVYAVNQTRASAISGSIGIAMAPCTVALQPGDTITITWSSTSTNIAGVGFITGAISNTAAAYDTGTAGGGTSTTASGSTTLSQANEIVIAGITQSSASVTEGNGFTQALLYNPFFVLSMAYKAVTSAAAYGYTATLGSSNPWGCVTAAYKGP